VSRSSSRLRCGAGASLILDIHVNRREVDEPGVDIEGGIAQLLSSTGSLSPPPETTTRPGAQF